VCHGLDRRGMHIKYFSEMWRKGIFGEFMHNYAKIGLFRMRREVEECKELDRFKSFGRVTRKNKANQIYVLKNREFF